MKLIIRWIITSFALVAAVWVVDGIRVEGDAWAAYIVTAAILGLINAFIRPLLKILTCPIILLTLGLFVLVINGLMLWLASSLAVNWFHVGFYVDGFWAAFWGALIVSVVSMILTVMVREKEFDRRGGYRRHH
jgi:putative membrane protein